MTILIHKHDEGEDVESKYTVGELLKSPQIHYFRFSTKHTHYQKNDPETKEVEKTRSLGERTVESYKGMTMMMFLSVGLASPLGGGDQVDERSLGFFPATGLKTAVLEKMGCQLKCNKQEK